MRRTLFFRLHFLCADKLRTWALGVWRDLPKPLRVLWYGDGERPRRQPDSSSENVPALERYLLQPQRREYGLFGERIWYDMFMRANPVSSREAREPELARGGSEMDVYAESQPELVRAFPELLLSLSDYGLIYGYGGMKAESERRNMYRIEVREAPGRFVTGWLGRDYTRHVPGLYWLNYFCSAYIVAHAVDLKAITSQLGGVLQEARGGSLLKLYQRPQDWVAADKAVSRAILETPGMFSIDRVSVPDRVSLRDRSWEADAGRRWP